MEHSIFIMFSVQPFMSIYSKYFPSSHLNASRRGVFEGNRGFTEEARHTGGEGRMASVFADGGFMVGVDCSGGGGVDDMVSRIQS